VAVSSVKLIVDAQNAVNPLKRVAKETAKTEKQVNLLKKAIKLQGAVTEAVGTKLHKFGNTAKNAFTKAQKAAGKLQAKLGGLKGAIVGLGAAALTKRIIGQAASFAQTQVRLKALSAEYGEFGQIQKLVKENAETFNQSQAESASNFADVFARLRPLGTSLEDIQTVYKGFNATALASGTSAAAASGAFLQLSQALGSGRLQGDEFRSIAEQVPGILRLVSDEMGVTVGELKKLGSDGKITSDILINSLAKGFEENKDKIQQLLAESPAQKFKEFSNATSELSNSIGTELLPVVTPAVQALTGMVGIVGKLPGPVRTLTSAVLGLAAAFVTASGAAAALGLKLKALILLGGKVALALGPILGVALAIEDATRRKEEFDKALESVSPTVLEEALNKANKELDQLNTASKKFESSPYYRGKIQDVNDLKRRLEEAKLQVEELTKRRTLVVDLIVSSKSIAEDVRSQTATGAPGGKGFDTLTSAELDEALGRTTKTKRSPRAAGSRAAAQTKDITAAMEALLLKEQELRFSGDELAQSRIQKEIEIQRLIESQLKPRELGIKLLKAENDELFRTATIFKQLFEGPAAIDEKIKAGNLEGVRAGFAAAKEADEKLQEQAKKLDSLYKGIGNTIQTGILDAIDTGIEGLINGTKDLGASLQEIASGVLRDIGKQLLSFGVKVGLQALSGGSSFFAEGGYVTGPTNAVIGEGGEPEYVIPESKMRESMGRYSRGSRGSSVIPAEGGGAAGAEGGVAVAAPIDVRYTVERINSVDYVTADQFQSGMKRAAAEGAQRGQQLTLSRLQQSPATRRRIGM